MKKLFVLILAPALLLSGCSLPVVIDTVDSVLETAPELQRVETSTFLVHRITTEYPDGREEKQTFEFDNRNYLQSCTYYLNGEETGTDTYTVDEYGNLLTVTPDYTEGKEQAYSYTYDENGKILTEEYYISGNLDYTAEYSYNESGTLTQKIVTPAKGLRSEYRYDPQGRETERLDYEGDAVQYRTVTEYAEYGKKQSVTVYGGDGTVTCREDYSFDSKSSKETILEFSGQGDLLRKRIVTYDTHDNPMMEEIYSPEDTLLSTSYRHIVQHKFIEYIEVTEPTQ